MNYKLEICVDSVESAINAQKGGAVRVELCDNLPEGGTTPSYGTILNARQNLDILLHVIIRPRGGDFLYSSLEYETMLRDIEMCGEIGADGIVIGLLNADGTIDVERTQQLVKAADTMAVTFHRAFDMCSDPLKGLEDIILTGATRILTSGQKDTVPLGADLISTLVKQAGERISIMPGSGLDESNIAEMARITGAREFHLTGRKNLESRMKFRREGIPMGGFPDIPEFSRKVADPERIRNIINILDSL
ncbi:MAG: copper homeostasis protein CutC [Bacteroidales bacterium]|nr:copper homeostasis protein CutC [Bacteroidales bacterium]